MHTPEWPAPENYLQLHALVQEAIARDGPDCDLNWVDLSRLDSLNFVFRGTAFTGDISRWNVSHIESMEYLFEECPFNGDISGWDTSNVRLMEGMFEQSSFDGDISNWNVGNVVSMERMFRHSTFNGCIARWCVDDLRRADGMFENSAFSGDLSGWRPRRLTSAQRMFHGSPFHGDLSGWQLPKMGARHTVQMFSSTFEGVPPLVGDTFVERHTYYTSFFKKRGQNKGMVRYLETHPFNALHLDLCLHSRRKPDGVREEDYAWVRSARAVGMGLGLQGNELRDHVMVHYAHRMPTDQGAMHEDTYDTATLFDAT